MRSWTVLLISHDTEEPRSIALSERLLRVGAAVVVVILFAAVIGIGTLAGRWASVGTGGSAVRMSSLSDGAGLPTGGELDSLRATVEALHQVLDTIRLSDARLREAAGLAATEPGAEASRASIALTRASADSLLAGASQVAERLVELADSARVRRAPSTRPSTRPPPSSTAPQR